MWLPKEMVSGVKDNDKEWLFCFYKLNAIAVEQKYIATLNTCQNGCKIYLLKYFDKSFII